MTGSAIHRAIGKPKLPDGAVFLSLICLVLLLTSLVLPSGGIPGMDLCGFHAWTGLPCPSCGLTRAFCALSRGHLQEAWALHPFSFPLYGLLLGGIAAPLLTHRFPALTGARAAKAFRLGALILAAALLIFGVWRARFVWHLHLATQGGQAYLPASPGIQVHR